MAYKCKIFEAVTDYFMDISNFYRHTCVQFEMLTEKKKKSAKQGIHKWSQMKINMVAKCIVHMHITIELKAYWLLDFLSCMGTNVMSIVYMYTIVAI